MSLKRKWYSYASRTIIRDGDGINDAWWLAHYSLGRQNSNASPYLLANEWICGNIGWYLRLPIPPFSLMRSGPTAKGFFASLKYGTRAMAPADINPAACVLAMPELCTLITVFDILIANHDRHKKNVKVDDPLSPSDIDLFDHDRALFGAKKNKGCEVLEKRKNDLGIGMSHCLAKAIHVSDWFLPCILKATAMPIGFVQDVCREAVGVGITTEESDAAWKFIQYRQEHIQGIVRDNKKYFSSVRHWNHIL